MPTLDVPGAVLHYQLAIRHPDQLRTLVAHEPIAPWLLPDPAAKLHRQELSIIRERYLADGLHAAIPEIVRSLGIDPAGAQTERNLTQFPMDAGRRANFDYFIRHDFTVAIHDDLDPLELRDVSTRIIAVAGAATPRTVYDYQCAQALAALEGQRLETFPGGHNGNRSHPRAYAARLKEILSPRR